MDIFQKHKVSKQQGEIFALFQILSYPALVNYHLKNFYAGSFCFVSSSRMSLS